MKLKNFADIVNFRMKKVVSFSLSEVEGATAEGGDESAAELTSSQALLRPLSAERDSRITEEEEQSYDCMSPRDVTTTTAQIALSDAQSTN